MNIINTVTFTAQLDRNYNYARMQMNLYDRNKLAWELLVIRHV